MPESASPASLSRVILQDHEGIKVGDRVFFNVSLSTPRYNTGIVKEIFIQKNEKVVFTIWDDDKGMWRHFTVESVFLKKPIHNRRDK